MAHFRATSAEDMESKYVRVITCSLLAVKKLLQGLPADQAATLTEQLKTLLDDPKFWKHGKHKVNMVGRLHMSCLMGKTNNLHMRKQRRRSASW